jgi:hypothetical protein
MTDAGRVLAWVDGVNSAVATLFALAENPDVIPVHCDLGDSVDADSRRFIDDLEGLYRKPIVRIRSSKYANVDEVFEKRKYMAGINGAICTSEMKVAPRLDFQLPSDRHIWGYAADKTDKTRFAKMLKAYPELSQRSPLIELGVTKAESHEIIAALGVRRPRVYDLGMPNGNCLGCVKSQSPRYWSHCRKHFPEVFARRAEQSRRLGVRLVQIKKHVRIFIDEIPLDYPTEIKGNFGGCGFSCVTA